MPIETDRLQHRLNGQQKEMQLGLMRKLSEIKQNLAELMPRAYHPYLHMLCMELAKSTQQLPDTTLITVADLQDEPTVNAYRNILDVVVLSTSMDNLILSINNLVRSNTTTNAWHLDSKNEAHLGLIKKMSEYKGFQIKYLSNMIGLASALDLYAKVTDAESLNGKENQAEIVVLKRHEVCSNITKGFGFLPDADLDVMREDVLKDYVLVGVDQTEEALFAAQQVQSARLRWMKEIWPEMCVEMTISPVSRAVSTALFATFDDFHTINKVTIDNNFSEQQSSLTAVCSGRASQRPSEIRPLFAAKGVSVVRIGNNELFVGESPDAFNARVETAAHDLLTRNPEVNTKRLHMVVGHGAMNKSILEKLKAICPRTNIPSQTRLNFGEEYWLVVLRDGEGNVSNIQFCGIYSRDGQKRFDIQPCDVFQDYFKVSDEERESYIVSKKESLLNNLDRLVIRNAAEVSQVDGLLKKLLSYHLAHIKSREDNPLARERATQSDSDRPGSGADLSALQETNAPTLYGFFSKLGSSLKCTVSNLLSGKYPQQQEIVLTALQELIERRASLAMLTTFRAEARKHINEGKVTKLIDAFIRLNELTLPLNAFNSPQEGANATRSGEVAPTTLGSGAAMSQ